MRTTGLLARSAKCPDVLVFCLCPCFRQTPPKSAEAFTLDDFVGDRASATPRGGLPEKRAAFLLVFNALPVLYQCFTRALHMLYTCFTRALPVPSGLLGGLGGVQRAQTPQNTPKDPENRLTAPFGGGGAVEKRPHFPMVLLVPAFLADPPEKCRGVYPRRFCRGSRLCNPGGPARKTGSISPLF